MSKSTITFLRWMQKHPVSANSDQVMLFLHLLAVAPSKSSELFGEKVEAGTIVTTRNELAEQLGCSPSKAYRAVQGLTQHGLIATEEGPSLSAVRGRKKTLIRVTNYRMFSTSKEGECAQSVRNKTAVAKRVAAGRNVSTTLRQLFDRC